MKIELISETSLILNTLHVAVQCNHHNESVVVYNWRGLCYILRSGYRMPVNGLRFGLSLLEQIRLVVRELRLESAPTLSYNVGSGRGRRLANAGSLDPSLFYVCISGISSDIWSYNRESCVVPIIELHLVPPRVSSRAHKQHSRAQPWTHDHDFNEESV
jgi:hypothetical protein